jgi:hypothetical protein
VCQGAKDRDKYRQAAGVVAMMRRILRFALVALMAIASAVFIYGMIKNLVVYRHRRPPPIRATHNRIRQPVKIAKLPELLRRR